MCGTCFLPWVKLVLLWMWLHRGPHVSIMWNGERLRELETIWSCWTRACRFLLLWSFPKRNGGTNTLAKQQLGGEDGGCSWGTMLESLRGLPGTKMSVRCILTVCLLRPRMQHVLAEKGNTPSPLLVKSSLKHC